MEGRPYERPGFAERLDTLILHYRNTLAYDGAYKAVREMRKHVGWYLKGMPSSTEVKNIINYETDPEVVLETLASYKEKLADKS